MQANSWRNFFSGLVLDVMHNGISERESRAEAGFIDRVLQVPRGAKVLDVPCGSGRHALELASLGYDVTGVDIVLPLIELAQEQAERRELHATWRQLDMRELPWRDEFDGATCMWGSFGFFDEAGDAAFLEAVSRALKPGASFVMDVLAIETVLPAFQARDWRRVGDILLHEERTYDHLESRYNREWTLVRGNIEEQRLLSMRLYTYRELCNLLSQAGFTNCRGYGTLNHEPFRFGLGRLLMVATKAGSA